MSKRGRSFIRDVALNLMEKLSSVGVLSPSRDQIKNTLSGKLFFGQVFSKVNENKFLIIYFTNESLKSSHL